MFFVSPQSSIYQGSTVIGQWFCYNQRRKIIQYFVGRKDRSIDLKMLLVGYPVRVISVAVLVATFNDAYFLAFTIEGVYFYYTVRQIFAFRFLELRLMIIYKTSPRTHHNYL